MSDVLRYLKRMFRDSYTIFSFPGSELPARTLSEILAPNRLMVNNTFELNVDQWKFVGHPFSVQNESFDKFNITFIIEVASYMYSYTSNFEIWKNMCIQ